MQNERRSVAQILQEWLVMKLLSHKVAKHSVYARHMYKNPEIATAIEERELRYIALVYDTEVVEMIRVDDLAAKMLLSKDTRFILYDPEVTEVQKGMRFLDGEFKREQENVQEKPED